MSLLIPAPPHPPADSEWPVRLSVEAYHQMISARILTEDDKVELLGGYIFPKMSKHPPHSVTISRAHAALLKAVGGDVLIRLQDAITLSDSEPEPDLVVARGTPLDYLEIHPRAADILLLIEVCDSSAYRDRKIKLPLYARNGISAYWIIDIQQHLIDVFTSPDPASGKFNTTLTFKPGQSIPLPSGAQVPVSDILTPPLPQGPVK